MKKAQSKRQEFQTYYNLGLAQGTEITSDEIFDKAFEMMKEGIINQTLNYTLDGDMNALDLDTLLNEPDHNKEAEKRDFKIEKASGLLADYLSENEHTTLALLLKLRQLRDIGEGSMSVDSIDGITPIEIFEHVFTVDSLLETLGYD